MDLMFEWEYEGDRFSFEDSDRFEEDSLCSWGSEPELCNNWRGWKRQNGGQALMQGLQAASGKCTVPLFPLFPFINQGFESSYSYFICS